MDAADRAQQEHDRAMARFERARMGGAPLPSATHCESCGHPIRQERRRLVPGVCTCAECQALIERGVMRL